MDRKRKAVLIGAVAGGIALCAYGGKTAASAVGTGSECGRMDFRNNKGGMKMRNEIELIPLAFDDLFDDRLPSVFGTYDPFAQMHRRMNRMLSAFEGELADSGRQVPARSMRMDAFVKDGRFRVETDLPGLKKEEIDVSVHDGMLSIKGEKKAGKDEKKEGYYLNERSSVSFARTISLPEGADADKAEVEFKDGVLKISMPFKELPKPELKKLPVK
jgi:HSP20 family protein